MKLTYGPDRVKWSCFLLMLMIISGLLFPPLLFVAFALNAALLLTWSTRESFFLLFFIMPFGLIYKYPGVSTSFMTLVELLVIVLAFCRRGKIRGSVLFTLTLICLYFLLRMNTYYMALPKLLSTYLLLEVFIQNHDKEDDARYVNYFIAGIITSSILGMFKENIPQLLAYYDDINYNYIDGVETLRFSGLFDDPNYFSIALLSAMIMLVFLKRYRNYPVGQFYLYFLTLAAMGLLTYSKSFILIFAAVLLLEIVLNLNGRRKWLIVLEILAIIVVTIYVFTGNSELFNMIFSRFDDNQGLTTGRDVIWEKYWTVINSKGSYFWIGLGLDAPYVGKASHSIYIEMIYYSGVVGLVLFFVGWVVMLFSQHKNRLRIKNLTLLVTVLVMYGFLCGFLNYAMPFYMIFCWMLMDMDFKEKSNAVTEKDRANTGNVAVRLSTNS